MSKTTLSIVCPAYNEEQRVVQLLNHLAEEAHTAIAEADLELVDVVLVDDGSTDNTVGVLNDHSSLIPNLRILTNGTVNRGKGAAVADGVKAANGDLTLITDVDLSTPLSEIGKLSSEIEEGADIAIGSRAIDRSLVVAPAYREYIGRTFNAYVRLMTGLPFIDTQCGFKLLRTAIGREILSEQITQGFAYDVELLLRARLGRLEVREVPVIYLHNHDSRVKIINSSLAMARDIARLAYHLRLILRTSQLTIAGCGFR